MQLDLTRYRQPLTHVSRQFQPAEVGSGGRGAYRVVAPVELAFDLHKDKNRFRVVGRVRDGARAAVQPVPRAVSPAGGRPLDLRYSAGVGDEDGETSEDRDMSSDDVDTSYYRDDLLDLNELLREQFYLALPDEAAVPRGLSRALSAVRGESEHGDVRLPARLGGSAARRSSDS